MIKSNQSIIEINGKRYDARTGKIVQTATKSVPATQTTKQPMATTQTRRPVTDISRQAPQTTTRNKRVTQKSQTLMRQAVKKPVAKPSIKSVNNSSHPDVQKPVKAGIKPAVRFSTTQDKDRHNRASTVKQNQMISKFGGAARSSQSTTPQSSGVDRRVTHMPVKPAPLAAKTAVSREKLVNQNISNVESILEKGLRNAQTHSQPKQKANSKKIKNNLRRKIVSYGAGIAAIVLLSGFYAYQNIPNISMRYATTRSGVAASLPGYKPAGFSMSNHIQYDPGQVTINFSSNSDQDRNFSITQKETTWNSDGLLTSYVSTKSDQIQKYEDKGRTIYLYGENNATWVNGGVWYDINGNSQLNPDQLIRIASSM